MRARAIEALAREGKSVAERLQAVLRSNTSSSRGRTGVIEVWGKMKTPGKEQLEEALFRFHTTHPAITLNTLSAIGELGPRAAWTAPTLLELIQRKGDRTFEDMNRLIQSSGIMALGRLGPPSSSARAALKKLVQDENPMVRTSAACALWWTGSEPEEVLPVLEDGLRSTDKVVMERAIYGVGEMGPQAAALLSDLDALRAKVSQETQIVIDEAMKKIRGFLPPANPRSPKSK